MIIFNGIKQYKTDVYLIVCWQYIAV